MESAFVTYAITVDGRTWFKSWFAGDEEYIRQNVAEQMKRPLEDVRVVRED